MGPGRVGLLGLAGVALCIVLGGFELAWLFLVIGGGGNRAYRYLPAGANSRKCNHI